jgi:hypothetical protein
MSIEAMKQALAALDMACAKYGNVGNMWTDWPKWDAAGCALRQAIKEAALDGLAATSREIEQEPVAWMKLEKHGIAFVPAGRINNPDKRDWLPLYTGAMSIKPENIDTKSEHVDSVDIEPVAWDGDCVLGHCGSPDGCDRSGCCRADTAPPDDLLRQSEHEGWRWARECEAEVKRLKDIIDELENDDPPKREWQGLDDNEIQDTDHFCGDVFEFARAIEAKLRERNT